MGALKETLDFQGVGVWCLTPLSTIFQLHRGGHLIFSQNSLFCV